MGDRNKEAKKEGNKERQAKKIPRAAGFEDKCIWNSGGATRSRTGLTGFAIPGITDLLSRPRQHAGTCWILPGSLKTRLPFSRYFQDIWQTGQRPACHVNVEREKSLELSTSTLARLRSTN